MKETLSMFLLAFLLLPSFFSFQARAAEGSEVHDVAVVDIAVRRMMMAPGTSNDINVTIENQGSVDESFSLTVYAGNLTVQSSSVDLAAGQNETLTFVWEIPGIMWAYIFQSPLWNTNPMIEDLTIRAEASVVAGEVDTSDNVYVDGTVTVIWRIGDVNGDGRIDIFDLVMLAGRYGSKPGDPRYDPLLDFSQNGIIDIFDVVATASSYGTHYLVKS